MKFLKKIKQWFGAPKVLLSITDEVFGKLILKEFKNSNYWQGILLFKPTRTEIEFFIRTKEKERPNSRQKDFFFDLNQNYSLLSKKWKKTINGEIGDSLFEMGITLENAPLENYFKLSHIEIPEIFNDEINWSVTFFAIPEIDPNHEFTIEMKGWKALGLYING
ncbi:hypothetical protein [Aureispira anguillae]|uniref:Uncharacterized protein n=1 Tax=Aureispira anguillae TaxID=2864201 RepID=A0A916DRJ3_9BACT|nr:hypothetical protein [Aureispira anguillae]BDS11301.1 hypothetical protein AsAng_0020130 [Aureispira anguillae]